MQEEKIFVIIFLIKGDLVMAEEKFNVMLDTHIVAENMTLEVALILVQGLFNKYYLEKNLKVTVQKVSVE